MRGGERGERGGREGGRGGVFDQRALLQLALNDDLLSTTLNQRLDREQSDARVRRACSDLRDLIGTPRSRFARLRPRLRSTAPAPSLQLSHLQIRLLPLLLPSYASSRSACTPYALIKSLLVSIPLSAKSL